MATVDLYYLLPQLRLRLGDTTETSYRYTDEWLMISLQSAVKNLQRFWNYKYLIDNSNEVYRNPNSSLFLFDESYGVIQPSDEYIIVLYATIIVLEGSLENSAWDAVSWKDAEISYSNLESYRTKDSNLKRLIDELKSLITPPTRKLAYTKKGSLPGYKNNPYEKSTEY